MDNLSSADLDASSKTPLFIGIAAVIIALTGVVIGWLGLSKASSLEARLAEISGASESITKLESTVNSNSETLRRAAGKISSIESSLSKVASDVQKDVSDVKKSMRSLAIQAGTALKKVEALEESGVAAAPAPSPSSPASSSSDKGTPASSSPGSAQTHTIASGDTYEKLRVLYKVTVNDLIDANPGVDPRRLRIGQEIVIPASN